MSFHYPDDNFFLSEVCCPHCEAKSYIDPDELPDYKPDYLKSVDEYGDFKVIVQCFECDQAFELEMNIQWKSIIRLQ